MPTASSSLWLRENIVLHQRSNRFTTLNLPCLPVLTTRAPSLERHHPDSMRMTSPTLTFWIWSAQNTNPTSPVSSRPQAAATGPVYREETIMRCGYILRMTSSNPRTGVFGRRFSMRFAGVGQARPGCFFITTEQSLNVLQSRWCFSSS